MAVACAVLFLFSLHSFNAAARRHNLLASWELSLTKKVCIPMDFVNANQPFDYLSKQKLSLERSTQRLF